MWTVPLVVSVLVPTMVVFVWTYRCFTSGMRDLQQMEGDVGVSPQAPAPQ